MAGNKKSVNLLPEYLRTTKNSKFLSSTIDPLISTPEIERIDGYVGSKLSLNYNPEKDFYIPEPSELRKNYSLEPSLVFKDKNSKINDVIAYDDLINEIKNYGADTSNLKKLFETKYYSYDPLIDWDKFVNFSEYYWLANGPDAIVIETECFDVNDILGKISYTMSNGYKLSNGMKLKFKNDAHPIQYAGKIFIVEGVGNNIQLVDYELLEPSEKLAEVYDETFDATGFDEYPFDSDRKIALTPEYITINRSSKDLNPWSRYNRWFHKEIIEISAILNNKVPVFPFNLKAKRPIIEFYPNIQLYNFGKTGIKNVDFIDTTTGNAFLSVEGCVGYHVDGKLLEHGHRVIFNADIDNDVKGKIYKVQYDLSSVVPRLHLIPDEDHQPGHLDSIAVNYGNKYAGATFYYDEELNAWTFSQQHTKLNETPLFDLFNSDGVSYTKIADKNNFTGNKIFGYDVGTGTPDSVLGFALKYQNSVGIGSYVFKNYFMTGVISKTVNSVSQEISTGITYLKINNIDGTETLLNVWNKSLQSDQSPIIETQVIEQTTSTISINSLDTPIFSKVNVYVNNVKKSVNATTGSNILTFTTPTTLNSNDVIVLKIVTDQIPNSNGYYQSPLSLTNNPLNGKIEDLTFSEMYDHLETMVEKIPNFTGNFPGVSNLRDLSDYSKYGSRLIVNSNPIAFTEFFLGKKQHNVIESLTSAADHYNQFKMLLLKLMVNISSQSSPADALDEILTQVNKNKTAESSYYRSDMLGFGIDKISKKIIIDDADINEYYLGYSFRLDELSFKSLLIYLNDELLIVGKDYSLEYVDDFLIISRPLSVNDVISIVYYGNTLGCYVPPTPSKLGLYPKYQPTIYYDTTYVDSPVKMIKGHDGSVMKAYNDYRDNIILEFEKRIFNNIKVEYNNELFDIIGLQPGAYRSTTNKEKFNDVVKKSFVYWAGKYNIDYFKNVTFDSSKSITWNYVNTVDRIFNKPLSGTWKSIFNYFYDTETPNLTPWEMLGFSIKPTWWEDVYGQAPYTSLNVLMWTDLQNGYNRFTGTTNLKYARNNLLSFIPVDATGNIRLPFQFLTTDNSYTDKQSSWSFGDYSPVETAWRNSSYYPFALNVAFAILKPLDYLTSMYDTSRTGLNVLNQLTYFENDLYLDLRKLVVDDGTTQTSGYSVYVCERGKRKYQNYIETLKSDLTFIDFNIFYKLGGFSSKEKLQINIDSVDPVSRSPGVILPPEDYSLFLNVSNPIDVINVSGIIIQRSDGKFIVKGYDTINPYFTIYQPIPSVTSGTVRVGGRSESFSEWSGVSSDTNKGLGSNDLVTANSVTTRFYKQGQVVRYNNVFYRVKISHSAQDTFDPDLFQQLSSLPIVGGVTATLPAKYSSTTSLIPYGTEFNTIQEVYDLILGYGKWLEVKGFIFDKFNSDLNEVINWKFSGKEFLYWTTQNWADNSLITLSPFSEILKFKSATSVVDNLISDDYEYSLLKADGFPYPRDKFKFSREDGYCVIETIDDNEGIFFASVRLVQKEHGMLFNNYTIFNDTIYDIETGYKQKRIKLSGFKTKNWNGDYFSPGFVYDAVDITDWSPYKFYNPGTVVRYNSAYYQSISKIESSNTFDFTQWVLLPEKPVSTLIPNFDYKINQFEDFYSLDIDNFDQSQQELAQHLIGYTPRTYLNNIFSNPISQYKFYQGFIKEKGTKKSINKLSKIKDYDRQSSVDVNEEWAFRIGYYGSYSSINEIEFNLKEGVNLENPSVFKIVNDIPTLPNNLISYIKVNDLLIKPDNYNVDSTFPTNDGTYDDNNIELLTAGYARLDDVTATAFNKNSLLDIANNEVIQSGNTIWVGFLENGGWDIFRYSRQTAKISGVYVNSPGTEITFVTDINHGLSIGDIVSVTRFNSQVNGVYIVKNIPRLTQFTVESSLTTIVNEELLALGVLFKFESSRVNNIDDLASLRDLINLKYGDKIWIDKNLNDKWQVIEKVENYKVQNYETPNAYGDQRLGFSIVASDSSNLIIVSSPGKWSPGDYNFGKVWVFENKGTLLEKQYEYGLNTNLLIYCNTATTTDFGHSIAYDENKKLFFTGAPLASNVRAPLTTGTVILSSGTGFVKSFINEGLVKVSSKKLSSQEDQTQFVLVNPVAVTTATAENAKFGYSIYINQPNISETTTLLVGAPNVIGSVTPGAVYAYSVSMSTASVASVVAHPSGISVKTSSTVVLNAGSQFGYKIAGSRSGSHIAISAPGYNVPVSGYKGIVQIYNKNLQWMQSITSPFETSTRFGDDVIISNSGNYLFISATNEQLLTPSLGKVAVYKLNLTTSLYELSQVIQNPLTDTNLKFGYKISISDDENTLAISALGTNRSQVMSFTDSTVFDADTTKFIQIIPDSGTVYVFNKLGNNFILSDELNNAEILSGSRYGSSVAATNNSIFVGAPAFLNSNLDPYIVPDDSKFYQFNKIDSTINGYKVIREQTPIVDIDKAKKIVLIDSLEEEIIDYLDVIDPLKGKISGLAEQELTYKLALDPAVYSIGIPSTTIDLESNWLDDHVGELWWDLSTAKFMWYEQGDDIYKKNNWGKLFPGASIDVYEWVKSSLLPSEWAAQADTNEGLAAGISGQPKYTDNSVVSVKQVYNNITGSLENVYYFWVKNKTLVPDVKNRRISSLQVASLISDPVANGVKFAEILSSTSIALANVQNLLVSNNVNVNILIDKIDNNIPKHTEWLLLQEGNSISMPNTLLEKKLFDSLLGHDSFGNNVPDPTLSSRNKYGLGIRPQQSMFVNRYEALRNVVKFANDILISNRITGNYSFINLEKQELIPDELSQEYDSIFSDNVELAAFDTSKLVRAELQCFVQNGRIRNVIISNSGFGYKSSPLITIESTSGSGAKINAIINANGEVISVSVVEAGTGYVTAPTLSVRPHSVIIVNDSTASNKWSKNEFNYALSTWVKVKTQTYNTPLYWKYVDWQDESFNQFKILSYSINSNSEISSIININNGDYVKVKNSGNGNYIILEKADIGNYIPGYNIVYVENGTIQIKDELWNYDLSKFAYDLLTLDETLYDQIPDLEIFYILTALKENIFIGELKVNWNLLFFAAIKYALSEQKLLDWAFKTSFITVKNNVGILDQRPVYKLDSDIYFEDFVKEVKPYHTNVRNYVTAYQSVESSNLQVTDFDLPFYFNSTTNSLEAITLDNPLINQSPWKQWADNYKYKVKEIIVANPGSGYSQRPLVQISAPQSGTTATAEAYIRSGGIYKIVVTNPGSGYTSLPVISIISTGTNITTATASVILTNDEIRKNIIGVKFDRISYNNDITIEPVTETFICDGVTTRFKLSWLAAHEKENIIPLLDGRPVYAVDYTIEFTEKRNSVSTFVFLNYVPSEGQLFKITYNKNIDIFNAVERINTYYQPDDTMIGNSLPMLMSGISYGNTVIQGLPFKYAVPWNKLNTNFGDFVWDELVDYYASAKITSVISVGATTIFVDSTEGIVPGQIVNVLNSSTTRIRQGTVVTSVSSGSNSITISSPTYDLKVVKATGTAVGSRISVITTQPFNGNIKAGDIVFLKNIPTSGYNGQYYISHIDSNDTFFVTATNILASATVSSLTSAQAQISSILTTILPNSVLLDRIVTTATNVSSISISSYSLYSDIKSSRVYVNGVQVTSYSIVNNPLLANRATINVVSLNTSLINQIDIFLYTHPKIEFWKTKTLVNDLDTSVSGGSWSTSGNFVGALGINPEEFIVDGGSYNGLDSNFAPEELVPGHVLDSLGINVYTRPEISKPVMITGALPAPISNTATYTLTFEPEPEARAGMLVYGSGLIFERINDTNFTKTNQYFLSGAEITIPPQGSWARIGYTIVTSGGSNVLDSNMISVSNTTTAIVQSLASINDVSSVYVLVNGQEVGVLTTSSAVGYVLTNTNNNNNRASVNVYNLPLGTNTIEAWFFRSRLDYFNRINEEYFDITSATSTLTLNDPPADIKPASAQAIVEVGLTTDNTRRRLLPPSVSYYIVINNQTTFNIDNKISRPAGYWSLSEIKVYANGAEIRPNIDYSLNASNNTISIISNLLSDGDTIAIESLKSYDYIINGNQLIFTNPVNNARVKVITFTDHDDLLMRTEQFSPIPINRYTLDISAINDNYVWVYLNGVPLIHRYDFEILDDLKTIQFNDSIETDGNDTIMISAFAVPSKYNEILGFRIFKDIFDRQDFKRLSSYYSTFLTKELTHFDTEIHVDNNDVLVTPNPGANNPGVIIIDGERIEFLEKEGNVLKHLRRTTLGTGAPNISHPGTMVIDQSIQQTIPYVERTYIQNIQSSNTTTYVITTVTSTLTGDGIILTPGIKAVDQIFVYFGGRQLRKSELVVHDIDVSFNNSIDSLKTLQPEFKVNTSTQELILTLPYAITTGTLITVVQKKGHVWTGTESLLTSEVPQAEFLRMKPTKLPDVYYYGGNKDLLDNSYFSLMNENDSPLEE